MPVSGPKPRASGQIRHRGQPAHEWTEVPDEPYEGQVPRLPKREGGWPAAAKRKWRAWSRMPHCVLWSAGDWEFALDTLEVFARFHEGSERVAGELRNREKVLGTTEDFRRDLRIRYVASELSGEEKADVSWIEEARRRSDYDVASAMLRRV